MNVFAKFGKIPSMILQDSKETKRYGHTFVRTDNVKTVYPPTNTVCGVYNDCLLNVEFPRNQEYLSEVSLAEGQSEPITLEMIT